MPENEERSEDELRRDSGCTEALPVPCHGKCTATFVHCLRDLHERQLMGEDLSIPAKEDAERSFVALANRWKGKHNKRQPEEGGFDLADSTKKRKKRTTKNKTKTKSAKQSLKRSSQIVRIE